MNGDLREIGAVLDGAATLDFSEPGAVMLLMILQYIPDAQGPWAM